MNTLAEWAILKNATKEKKATFSSEEFEMFMKFIDKKIETYVFDKFNQHDLQGFEEEKLDIIEKELFEEGLTPFEIQKYLMQFLCKPKKKSKTIRSKFYRHLMHT